MTPPKRRKNMSNTIDKSTEQISKAMIGSVQKVLVENKRLLNPHIL
jgi:tRNA A37 methylthiotransferase MiaB